LKNWGEIEQERGEIGGYKGPFIYDVHNKIRFLTPPLVHMRSHGPDPSPCGRPHAVDMKYTRTALLKRLVQ